MNPDRRVFLKKAIRTAGAVTAWDIGTVLYNLGGASLVREAEAADVFISGHAGEKSCGVSWSDWGESEESSLACNSPGGLICVAKAEGGLGEDETAQGGGVSGADLVLSDVGGIAGIAGGYRELSPGQSLTATAGLLNAVIGNTSTYSIILKCKNSLQVPNNHIYLSGGTDAIYCQRPTANLTKLKLFYEINGGAILTTTTTDALAANAEFYLYFVHTGTKYYHGFSLVRPVTSAHVEANKSGNVVDSSQLDGNFDGNRNIIMTGGAGTGICFGYMVLSNTCLISGL